MLGGGRGGDTGDTTFIRLIGMCGPCEMLLLLLCTPLKSLKRKHSFWPQNIKIPLERFLVLNRIRFLQRGWRTTKPIFGSTPSSPRRVGIECCEAWRYTYKTFRLLNPTNLSLVFWSWFSPKSLQYQSKRLELFLQTGLINTKWNYETEHCFILTVF